MKFIIDNKIPFIKGTLEKFGEVKYLPGNKIGPDDVKDASALIIRTRTKCNKSLLDGSKVKFIATATIGFDHIDTEYCEQEGIQWTNAPGCNSSSVEQYIVSSILYLANMSGLNLNETTIGIIGVGNVGSKVKRAMEALACKVLLNDPPREKSEGKSEFTDLNDLLAQSDIVTMHVPLTESGPYKTIYMAEKSFFEAMKDAAVFINTSRGEIVNEVDLKNALRSEKLSDAILDVFNNEPLIDKELLGMLCLATPHIAGYSADGKANGTRMSVAAISKYFKLGIDDWTPSGIPMPGNKEIQIDGSDSEQIELISEVYGQTYSVQEDHDRFIDNMDKFEKLRGDYRIRREPSAYSVRVFNDDGVYRQIFEGLGFDVIGDSCF